MSRFGIGNGNGRGKAGRRRGGWLRAWVAGAAALGFCAAALAVDRVQLIEGTTIRGPGIVGGAVSGKIARETADAVVVTTGTGDVTVPIDQIERVTYDEALPSFVRANSLLNGGSLPEAAEEFKKATGEAASAFLRLAAQFQETRIRGELALTDPAAIDEGIARVRAFLEANRQSRHAGPALELLARLSIAKGDLAGANEAIEEYAKLSWAGDRSKLLRARAAAIGDDAARDAALTDLNLLIESASASAALKREGQLAKAETLAASKRFEEAEATVREVIKSANPEDAATLAAAYNTLGDCQKAAGKPKDALLAYLHTDLLYSGNKEQHARALANIAGLWKTLNRPDRANDTLARLRESYPRSPYLKLAEGQP